MKSRNDIITDSVDLTFIFVKGEPLRIYDEDLLELSHITYTTNDYPIYSIEFPNLITLNGSIQNTIENPLLGTISLPSLNNINSNINIECNISNLNIDLSSLTQSKNISIVNNAGITDFDLTNLQEINGIGSNVANFNINGDINLNNLISIIGGSISIALIGSYSTNIDLSSLQSVDGYIDIDAGSYISTFNLTNLINNNNTYVSLQNMNYTDIEINSLTQSEIQFNEVGNISLNGLVESNIFTIMNSTASYLTFSSLKNSGNISISDCDNLISFDISSLDNMIGGINQISFQNNLSLTNINISSLTQSGDWVISNCDSLTQSNFNNLIEAASIEITNNDNLEEISFNSLTTSSNIKINNNGSLEYIDLSSLDNMKVMSYYIGNFNIYIDESNVNLKSINLSSLVNLVGSPKFISLVFSTGFPNLEEVILNNATDADSIDIRYANLTQTAVDNILVALDTAGYSNGTVNLSGGTSAAPSVGTGQPAVTSLQGKGWTVTTN